VKLSYQACLLKNIQNYCVISELIFNTDRDILTEDHRNAIVLPHQKDVIHECPKLASDIRPEPRAKVAPAGKKRRERNQGDPDDA